MLVNSFAIYNLLYEFNYGL